MQKITLTITQQFEQARLLLKENGLVYLSGLMAMIPAGKNVIEIRVSTAETIIKILTTERKSLANCNPENMSDQEAVTNAETIAALATIINHLTDAIKF